MTLEVKLYIRVMQTELAPLETKQELEQWLKLLEARWDSGNIGGPQEIIKLDRQIKEIRKRLQAMGV